MGSTTKFKLNLAYLSWPPISNKIDAKYICSICKNILRDAHQADDCGCRYCSECMNSL